MACKLLQASFQQQQLRCSSALWPRSRSQDKLTPSRRKPRTQLLASKQLSTWDSLKAGARWVMRVRTHAGTSANAWQCTAWTGGSQERPNVMLLACTSPTYGLHSSAPCVHFFVPNMPPICCRQAGQQLAHKTAASCDAAAAQYEQHLHHRQHALACCRSPRPQAHICACRHACSST